MAAKTLALAVVLAGGGIGLGEPPVKDKKDKAAPGKSKLEEMLAEALKSNPDIRVAAAKLAEADAELNRTRLQVTQKIVALHYAIDTQKKAVEHQERKVKRFQELAKRAAISAEDYAEVEQALTLAKAKLAELESQMPVLLGKAPGMTERDAKLDALLRELEKGRLETENALALYQLTLRLATKDWEIAKDPRKADGPVAEKIRKALVKSVELNFKDARVKDVVDDLQSHFGLNIKLVEDTRAPLPEKITMRLETVPLGAALQCLEDSLPYYRIVVRDYGLLITHRQSIPPGATLLYEFRKQLKEATPRQGAKNRPTEDLEGVVKKVDASSGLMTLSIGSDAGLAKGHTLEVFRLTPTPKYLGRIRILEVTATEAVGQADKKMTEKPKAGDRVASRILGQ
jgi:hypothetical protein